MHIIKTIQSSIVVFNTVVLMKKLEKKITNFHLNAISDRFYYLALPITFANSLDPDQA